MNWGQRSLVSGPLLHPKQMKENIIRVGSHAEYVEVYRRWGFAVYEKTSCEAVSFIVAKIPDAALITEPPPIPTSALQEFRSKSEAITALDKWAEAPVDVPMLKKPKEATSLYVNVERPKRKVVGPGQMNLPLE